MTVLSVVVKREVCVETLATSWYSSGTRRWLCRRGYSLLTCPRDIAAVLRDIAAVLRNIAAVLREVKDIAVKWGGTAVK